MACEGFLLSYSSPIVHVPCRKGMLSVLCPVPYLETIDRLPVPKGIKINQLAICKLHREVQRQIDKESRRYLVSMPIYGGERSIRVFIRISLQINILRSSITITAQSSPITATMLTLHGMQRASLKIAIRRKNQTPDPENSPSTQH